MILVTGGTGFLGSHLALHLLENNKSVRVLYRVPEKKLNTRTLFSLYKKENLYEKINWIQGDITDITSLNRVLAEDISEVYHCAGLVSFDTNKEELIRNTNINGTANIVNFCLAFDIKKLCHISSISALGDLVSKDKIITETTDWNPEYHHSDYAISKYGAEMEVWRGHQEGLDIIIVNPGIILGPVPEGVSWTDGSALLVSKIKKGLPFYTKGTTGFVAVTDVAKIAFELMQSDIKNERFILIAQNLRYKKIITYLADSIGKKRPRWEIKPWLLEIIWRVDWFLTTFFWKKRVLSRDLARSAYLTNIYCNEKIFKSLQFSFKDIKEYIEEISILGK